VEPSNCNRISFSSTSALPRLNGIAAAHQIRKLAPKANIIFVSQEFSPDIVQEALSLGAWGYVIKTHAGTDLLVAVDAVLEGRQFVSAALSGRGVTMQGVAVTALQESSEAKTAAFDRSRAVEALRP
jgi:DNA-binding NarL/FixJ family response regulator